MEKEGRERNEKGAGIRKMGEESRNRAADWLRQALIARTISPVPSLFVAKRRST